MPERIAQAHTFHARRLVTRTVYPTIPPRVEYQLTSLGRTLREPLIAVANWVKKNQLAMVEA